MKKLLFVLLLCPLMVMTSCRDSSGSNNKAKELLLVNDIKAANEQFPMQVDYATTALSVALEGDYVVYSYEVNESLVDMADLDPESFKKQLKNNFTAAYKTQPDYHMSMSLVKETEKSLRYKYKGSLSGKTIAIDFSNAELHEMFEDE